jgi:chromate reductase
MVKLVGVSGSLRQGSFNSALLRAAADLMPEGATLEIAPISGIPLYDGDLEAESGLPAAATSLKEAVATADGVVLATPEYNNGVPGVFKNAIDWTTRPGADIPRVWGAKPVAVMGASPGGFGAILAQNAWLPILHTLGAQQWHGSRLMVSRAASVFDAEGLLIDDKVRQQLRAFLAGFVAFAAR